MNSYLFQAYLWEGEHYDIDKNLISVHRIHFAAANDAHFAIRRVNINKQSFLLENVLLECASDSAVASRLYFCVWTLL